MKKIKYAKLDELINENRIDLSCGRVNLFINLEPILNTLVTKQIDDYLRVKNESKIFQIIANIINLAAHYRLYFSSRKIESTVYLYMQHPFDTIFKNRRYNHEYRRVYTFKYVDNINNYIICDNLTAAIPLIKIILEYIENVFFIESGEIENSVIPYILTRDSEGVNFILSNKIYDMQYVSYDFNILYPKQDESLIVTKTNFKSTFGKIYKLNVDNVTYNQLPFILSMVGNPDRNIYGIRGIGLKRAFSVISSAIRNNVISKDTNNINILIELLKKQYRDSVLENYCCTDIVSQYKDCTKKDIYPIMQLINKFDNDALKSLNDKFFEEYPLMLEAITSKPKKSNNIVF